MTKPTNHYLGCIEEWKVSLAMSRIKAFGIPRHQWPDALQQLVIALSKFRFRPDRANGAKESTALYVLMNRRLISMTRAEQRHRDGLTRHRDAHGLSPSNADRHPLLVYEDDAPMRFDVRLATAGLTARQQAVCEGLSRGDSVRQIAEALGCSWHTIGRLIASIRTHFTQIGLDGWVHD